MYRKTCDMSLGNWIGTFNDISIDIPMGLIFASGSTCDCLNLGH